MWTAISNTQIIGGDFISASPLGMFLIHWTEAVHSTWLRWLGSCLPRVVQITVGAFQNVKILKPLVGIKPLQRRERWDPAGGVAVGWCPIDDSISMAGIQIQPDFGNIFENPACQKWRI